MNIFRKKTKIICTIGPATRDVSTLKRMVRAGMNLARLNFSHGSYNEHEAAFNNIRAASNKLKVPVGIIQDLQGPKMRLGIIPGGERRLKQGQEVIFTTDEKTTSDEIFIAYPQFHKDVKEKQKFFLCDGAIKMEILQKKGKRVFCKVITGGVISSHKGVNLPETNISAPSVTEKDIEDLNFGIKLGVDYIAISFVRKYEDVLKVKEQIERKGKTIPVIAKIEKPEAVRNIDAIIDASDAIMVARGDMGIELPLAEVPVIQKDIISKCNLLGKPVITATQMLETMILNPFPTRAEVSDVANAVLDGTSAVMLSGETAVGKYPVKVVQTMAQTLVETEKAIDYKNIDRKKIASCTSSGADAIAHAAVTVAEDMNVGVVVPFTLSGSTAMMLSKYRPQAPILALTPDTGICNRMTLLWNVFPSLAENALNTEDMIETAEKQVKAYDLAKMDGLIVIVAGIPISTPGITNLIKLHMIK
jgi:pyruvate kinase